jgi:DNA-binding transcriptional regulator YhcF (GntR family)
MSPAAQAVLDAAFTLADNLDRDVTDTEMIAAALRATVQELKYFGITEKNILAIATELENSNV